MYLICPKKRMNKLPKCKKVWNPWFLFYVYIYIYIYISFKHAFFKRDTKKYVVFPTLLARLELPPAGWWHFSWYSSSWATWWWARALHGLRAHQSPTATIKNDPNTSGWREASFFFLRIFHNTTSRNNRFLQQKWEKRSTICVTLYLQNLRI